MDSADDKLARHKLMAFTLPMAAFLLLLVLSGLLQNEGGAFWLRSPEFWIYPAQTIICGALLLWFWREYELRAPRQIVLTLVLAVFVFAFWVAPQEIFGFAPRFDGFNPEVFSGRPAAYWSTIAFRFLRLVVVVPLVEEIFWRGFALRYFINERFHNVPIGAFSWFSFAVVTLAFGLSHSWADWIAALIAGALYNWLAYRTKSLASCIFAHAFTNLLLGLWIMKSRQWGFW